MNQTDVDLIEQVLSAKDQPLPIEGTLKIEGDKLHMDVHGRATVEGSGVVNTLILSGLNTVIDEDFTTDENRALDDVGIVHIWLRLADPEKLWRK